MFKFRKKEEKAEKKIPTERGNITIKVLGAGCKTCREMYERVQEAASRLAVNAHVEYVTDMQKIAHYGVMSLPALVVNEKVVSAGKPLKAAELDALLKG